MPVMRIGVSRVPVRVVIPEDWPVSASRHACVIRIPFQSNEVSSIAFQIEMDLQEEPAHKIQTHLDSDNMGLGAVNR